MLTTTEQRVMRAFRQYMLSPGQMLCFYGPQLKKYKPTLQQLTEKKFLVKERFKGAYSLTLSGYRAMRSCEKSEVGSKS